MNPPRRWLQAAAPGARLCDLAPERLRLDVIRAGNLAADLDHRDPLPVPGLQFVVPGDVHLAQVEVQLGLQLVEPCASELAQVAALRAVKDDFYGYIPRVVVASATRWTAIP